MISNAAEDERLTSETMHSTGSLLDKSIDALIFLTFCDTSANESKNRICNRRCFIY